MDNKKFPPLEPDASLSEAFPDIPRQMEPLEERPVIEELSFEQDAPTEESLPDEPPVPEISEEIPVIGELAFQEETELYPEADPHIPCGEADIPEETVLPEPPETPESMPAALDTLPAVSESPEESQAEDYGSAMMQDDPTPQWEDTDSLLTESQNTLPLPETELSEDLEYRDDSADFENLMNSSPPQPVSSAPVNPAGTTKGRPKRKKGEGLLGIPSILATFVWLALILVIGVTAGRMLWICAADVLAFGREDKVVTVTVYEADTMEDIIEKLHTGGLIRYKSLFRLYAGISDAEEDIKPGIYDLNTRYDYHALVNFMSPRSSREVIKLTIPEGYTCRQIFSLLEENRICTAVDAAAYAANGELGEYWFLDGLERGTENCLEGYLFPDTYEFYKNSTPREAIERMLDNFENRFDEDMIAQLDAINSKFRADYGVREIVIIASLIEKESAAPGESPMVSGVIYNRLFRWGNNRPLLNIDATIVYAQEGQNARIDTQLDHPYNTYLYEGLTPGPIANPGLSSLKAALNPESHNYYYYVLNPSTGMHQFSTTYEEHQGYVREFNASPEIEIE